MLNEVVLQNFVSTVSDSEGALGELRFAANGVKLPIVYFGKPLLGEISEYYSHIDINESVYVGGTLALELLPPHKLEKSCEGWKTVLDESGIKSANKEWSDNWVVFARKNDDPLIAVSSDDKSEVYGIIESRKLKIAESLESFLDTYCSAVNIEMKNYDGFAQDDDFNISEDYIKDIESLCSKSDGILAENFMEFFFF